MPRPGLCGATWYSSRPNRPAVTDPGAIMRRELVCPLLISGCSARVRTSTSAGSRCDMPATLAVRPRGGQPALRGVICPTRNASVV